MRSANSLMPTANDQIRPAPRVHVAGPVEVEATRGRRRRVQRCLRCDLVLWMSSGSAFQRVEHPIGNAIAWVEVEGTLTLQDLGRPNRLAGELPCEPLPSSLL